MKINCGEFTTLVEILRPTKKRTESGAVRKSYESAGSVLVRLANRTIGEEADGTKIEMVNVVELTTYLYKEITNGCRVVIDGAEYEIESTEELQRTYMRIIAKKI